MTGPTALEPRARLVVNADDFGLCPGVNCGILHARRRGIVTSASLMVRRAAAAHAAALARSESSLSVGLHFDLGEWVFGDDAWRPAWQTADADDAGAVAAELETQLGIFEWLLGRPPTHLDSHQHVHRAEPVRSVLARAAERLGIPLREMGPGPRYVGDFYGQAGPGDSMPGLIGVPALLGILEALPAGITELGCHPGIGSDIPSAYAAERAIETETLCDARVRGRLTELRIELISYHDLQAGAAVP